MNRPEHGFRSWNDLREEPPASENSVSASEQKESGSEDSLFGLAALIALGGALFAGMYCAFHFLGISDKMLCGACGIGCAALSVVLWAACCRTFEQVKYVVVIQAVVSIFFVAGVLL